MGTTSEKKGKDMTSNSTKNILIVGVGGQGVILASEILSEVARVNGLDAKKSEVHGMSQRGGVVSSHVRFGEKVYSPLIPEGEADVVLSFELAEALRWIYYLKEDGSLIVNRLKLIPPITTTGKYSYPEGVEEKLSSTIANTMIIDAISIAKELGNPRLVNTILLGVLSNLIEFDEESWLKVIEERAPKGTGELNKKAFLEGRKIKK